MHVALMRLVVKGPLGRDRAELQFTFLGCCNRQGCKNLAGLVDIPDGVTSLEEEAFQHCSQISEVRLPGSLVSLGQHSFEGCGKLAAVRFQGKSQLKSVGHYVFRFSAPGMCVECRPAAKFALIQQKAKQLTVCPTKEPTAAPTREPTAAPTEDPSQAPTPAPTTAKLCGRGEFRDPVRNLCEPCPTSTFRSGFWFNLRFSLASPHSLIGVVAPRLLPRARVASVSHFLEGC